jgi:DtxR family transcriptional regulator, Mn-dependent transcriptional regulator
VLTPAMQDYLKTIYLLQQQHGNVSTSMVAEQMAISAASVTGMIKKLASLEMVEHEPYRGVRLLPAGEQIALETLRHHRLLELFLTEILGFSWDEVHEEADRLEHHISEALEARISAVLGEPTHDPHGDPIPTVTGRVPVLEMHPLPALGEGNSGIVARVATQDDEILRYLGRLGLGLNVQVELLDVAPFNGPLTVRVEDEREISLARDLSEKVLVLHVVQPGE